jgi:hypothetical protein
MPFITKILPVILRVAKVYGRGPFQSQRRCEDVLFSKAAVQSNVAQLLSKDMQDLMLHQSTYVRECAALAGHLEGTDEDAPATALQKVDACWAQLLTALAAVRTGVGLFMLFNSMHAPPSHWMWYILGGVKTSLVVRSLAVRCQWVSVLSKTGMVHLECCLVACMQMLGRYEQGAHHQSFSGSSYWKSAVALQDVVLICSYMEC